MTDDPFERVVAREEELRASQERGVSLTPSQLQRVVDEGMDIEAVFEVLGLELAMSTDDVLDLFANYCPEPAFFRALAQLCDVDAHGAERLLENDVSPSDVAALLATGARVSVGEAADIVDEGGDLRALAHDIARYGLEELTGSQIARLVGEGIELEDVARLRDAGAEDAAEAALRDTNRSVMVGLNFRVGDTQQAWGAGRSQVKHDGRVRGIWFGSLHVAPGVRASVDGIVIGDVIVEPDATVSISGTVMGRVRNRGGEVTVTGRVTGDVVEEAAT